MEGKNMNALVCNRDGSCGVAERGRPQIGRGQLLVETRAASFNRGDYAFKKNLRVTADATALSSGTIVGADVAGIVAQASPEVDGFKPGDAVCAVCPVLKGAMAEYVAVDAKWAARIPENMSFDQGAALPSAGVTALAAVRKACAGGAERVLVCGASGGVGQYAVLLAAETGAEVWGACRPGNFPVARGCGASGCFDYTEGLAGVPGGMFDAVIAVNGRLRAADYAHVLRPGGAFVAVGMDSLRPSVLALPFRGRKVRAGLFFSEIGKEGLTETVRRVAALEGSPTLQACDGLAEGAVALASLPASHPSGKVVVSMR